MSEQPNEDREPPRLQDTTERSALPLPLPDDPPGGGVASEPAADAAPPTEAATPSEPAPPSEPASPPSEPVAAEAPADKSAAVPAPEPPPAPSEPFDPPTPDEAGPRPEVLVGAAFVGGLVLALLIKRLGR